MRPLQCSRRHRPAQIPGLTVPISHLLPLLLTLLATQLTHEAGHLLLAALDSIEPVQIVLRVIAGFAGMGVVFGEELEQKSGWVRGGEDGAE